MVSKKAIRTKKTMLGKMVIYFFNCARSVKIWAACSDGLTLS
jgi:hypothetical protein